MSEEAEGQQKGRVNSGMSGETANSESGWTTDTLHSLVETKISGLLELQDRSEADVQRQLQQIDAAFQQQLNDLRVMLNERYQTQTKAVDAAFIAQSTAMQTAFTAADRAVQAALESAEKAVTKAETAAEKRFEAVNEFRGQLADQASTFLPRTEADVRISALAEKLDLGVGRNVQSIADNDQRSVNRYTELAKHLSEMDQRHLLLMNELDKRVTSRLDVTAGQVAGKADQVTNNRLATSSTIAMGTFFAFIVSIAVAIFVAVHG